MPCGPGSPGRPGALTAALIPTSGTRSVSSLPTHLGASEVAAELYLSANTVKAHLRHLSRKLGVHSRREAVQRARAMGLLTGSSRWP
jgi:LuxR family transcriptional regulator, maltose regulon positive regulatory protein